jgi:predicted metallopeptidase
MSEITTEQIWVTVKEAAEVAGYTPAYLIQLVKEMLLQPESERVMQVRQEENLYYIWLPDLIGFVAEYAAGRVNTTAEEIWVNATEGAEITGYNPGHLRRIVRENWNLPDEQRLFKIRKRSGGYDIWLPDLINYINQHGHGPYQKPRRK